MNDLQQMIEDISYDALNRQTDAIERYIRDQMRVRGITKEELVNYVIEYHTPAITVLPNDFNETMYTIRQICLFRPKTDEEKRNEMVTAQEIKYMMEIKQIAEDPKKNATDRLSAISEVVNLWLDDKDSES